MSIFVSFWGSICFIRVAYISLSLVQHQLSGWLMIFAGFKRIFLIPVVHTERRRCAPPFNSRAHSSMAWLNQTFPCTCCRNLVFRAACSDAWKQWRLFGNVLNTIKTSRMGGTRSARIKAHGDDGFPIARVMTSFKKCFTSVLVIRARSSVCAGSSDVGFTSFQAAGCRVSSA